MQRFKLKFVLFIPHKAQKIHNGVQKSVQQKKEGKNRKSKIRKNSLATKSTSKIRDKNLTAAKSMNTKVCLSKSKNSKELTRDVWSPQSLSCQPTENQNTYQLVT